MAIQLPSVDVEAYTYAAFPRPTELLPSLAGPTDYSPGSGPPGVMAPAARARARARAPAARANRPKGRGGGWGYCATRVLD